MLSNKKQLTLPSTTVESIVREETKDRNPSLSSTSEDKTDVDANDSFLSDDSSTTCDGDNNTSGTASSDDDLGTALPNYADNEKQQILTESTAKELARGARCNIVLMFK